MVVEGVTTRNAKKLESLVLLIMNLYPRASAEILLKSRGQIWNIFHRFHSPDNYKGNTVSTTLCRSF